MKPLFLLLLSSIAVSSVAGFRVRNVESGKCVEDTDEPSEATKYHVQSDCSAAGSEFDLEDGGAENQFSVTSRMTASEDGERKCMHLNHEEDPASDTVYVTGFKCARKGMDPRSQWNLTNVEDDRYLVQHAKSGMCLFPEEGGKEFLTATKHCSPNYKRMLWTQY